VTHLGEHGDRIAAHHANCVQHGGHIGAQERVGGFSSPSSDGTVASLRARAASTSTTR